MSRRRVSASFYSKIGANRLVVNLSSGAAQIYCFGSGFGMAQVGSATPALCAAISSSACTWEDVTATLAVEQAAEWENGGHMAAYCCSKTLLSGYAIVAARENPTLTVTFISPGFINTAMTAGFGASLSPEEGAVSARYCLFGEVTSGWFYGSDGKRSPMHKGRDPGEPEKDGVI